MEESIGLEGLRSGSLKLETESFSISIWVKQVHMRMGSTRILLVAIGITYREEKVAPLLLLHKKQKTKMVVDFFLRTGSTSTYHFFLRPINRTQRPIFNRTCVCIDRN